MGGLFGAIIKAQDEMRSLTMEEWVRMQSGGAVAHTGIAVSPESAMRYTTVMICVRVLAESVASLPCVLYKRRKDDGKDRADGHPTYHVLHNQANAWNTAFEYTEGTMGNLAMRGNGYAYVERNSLGQTTATIPLNPDPVKIEQASDWSPIYTVTLPDNTRTKLKRSEIHHIRGPFPKGYVGQSMISLARESIGLGLAASASAPTCTPTASSRAVCLSIQRRSGLLRRRTSGSHSRGATPDSRTLAAHSFSRRA